MKRIEFPPSSYSEVGQTYPQLFKVARFGDGVLEELSSWFKCREFLNDIVYWRHIGDDTRSMYSFRCPKKLPNALVLKRGPMLDNIHTNEGLLSEAMEGQVDYVWLDDDVLLIPESLFDHSFKIAMFTYLLKVFCQQPWSSLEEALKNCTGNEKSIQTEYFVTPATILKSMGLLSKLPKQVSFDSYPHGMGVGYFLYTKTKSAHNKDVQDALSLL